MLQLVSDIHTSASSQSQWRFSYDAVAFKDAKRKGNSSAAVLGWIHDTESGDFVGIKHVHVKDGLLQWITKIDMKQCVRGRAVGSEAAAF